MQLSVVQPIAPKWADIREAASVAYHYIVVKGNKPIVREYPNGILTAPGANTKLSKSAPLPIWGLTLAPAGQSGYQTGAPDGVDCIDLDSGGVECIRIGGFTRLTLLHEQRAAGFGHPGGRQARRVLEEQAWAVIALVI